MGWVFLFVCCCWFFLGGGVRGGVDSGWEGFVCV